LIDGVGGVHSLARRIEGVTAQDVRARMADIDPMQLPSVTEARTMQLAKLPQSPMLTFPREITRQARQRTKARDKAQPARSATTSRGQDQRAPIAGLYVTVSRKRLDYGRPLIQAGANVNTPPILSSAQITVRGEFRGLARMAVLPVVSPRSQSFEKPLRPVTVTAGERVTGAADNAETDGADDGLSAFLAAIADEVQGRAASVCEGLSAEFAGRIKAAIASLPRDQAATAIVALKQMRRTAVKAVQEAAAVEVRGRQKVANVMWKRKGMWSISSGRNSRDELAP
jgi:hypothetical protein